MYGQKQVGASHCTLGVPVGGGGGTLADPGRGVARASEGPRKLREGLDCYLPIRLGGPGHRGLLGTAQVSSTA